MRKDGAGSRTPDLPGPNVTAIDSRLGRRGPSAKWQSDSIATDKLLKKSSIEFTAYEYPTGWRRTQHRWKIEVPTDDLPTAVAARLFDDYDVAGERTWGGLSLERWQLAPIANGFSVTRPIATAPIGVPVVTGPTTLIESAHYHEPDIRPDPHFQRTQLAVPDDWLWVRRLAVDPDERYLLALVETDRDDSTLYRYDLSTQAAEWVSDGEREPALILCESIRFADRETGERVALHRTTTGHTLMFVDADGDERFERSELHDFDSTERDGVLRIAVRY